LNRRSIALFAAALATLCPLTTLADPAATTAPSAAASAVVEALQHRLAPHPRLLLDRQGQKTLAANIGKDARLRSLYGRLLDHADALLAQPPLQKQMKGKRMTAGYTFTDRIGTCALAYRLTGDKRFLNFARDTMLVGASFDDWHPAHFLDTAEMTFAMSIGYDWLHDDLSADDRATIRGAIAQKGLNASFTDKPMWWVTTDNNWSQVCHGSLIMGALAIADDEPELAAKVVKRAVEDMPIMLKHLEPDGGYPEGMGYWLFGTTHNVFASASLQTALGDTFGTLPPGLLKSAYYRLHLVGPSGTAFIYSDVGAKTGSEMSPAAYYLATQNNDPSLLYTEIPKFDHLLKGPKATAAGDTTDWQLLLFVPPGLERVKPSTTHYAAAGDTPVASHRSGWDDTSTFVAIKGGSPGENHAHMDVGSFCLDALGVRWVDSLGAQDYNSLESKNLNIWSNRQGSERWKVFRLGVMSQNILTIDGQEQTVAGSAPIVKSTDSFTTLDLAPVYAGQLSAAMRGIQLRPDATVRLQDEIKNTAKPVTVRWAVLTGTDAKVQGSTATLKKKDKTLQVRVVSPANATLKIVSTDPPHDYDAKNPGTCLLTFEVKLQPNEAQTLVVDFIPGGTGATEQPVIPLADWK